MTRFLWSKSGDDTGTGKIQRFLSGQDVILDQELLEFDLQATAAHAAGLKQLGILTDDGLQLIRSALGEMREQFFHGELRLEPPLEDSHSAIEFWLTEKLPELGPQLHTGRSRNDQVQVALRLYMRDALERLAETCIQLAERFLRRALRDEMTPMPGYTHLQRAVPSTVGLWMGSFAESFLDTSLLVSSTRDWLNTCPLGTAAGYGVNLPLDRQGVSDELGFERLQLNPMYVQNSRGRFELQTLSALAQATLELRRFAWDLSLFSCEEFGFARLPAEYCTGSSIMPNKSNPDFVELLRGQHAVVQGAMSEIQSVLSLSSGYHRDLQLTKGPLLRAVGTSLLALELTVELPLSIQLDEPRMAAAIDSDLYATDIAVERVIRGDASFREAYRQPVSDKERSGRSPEKSVAARLSPGGCGDLRLEELRRRLDDIAGLDETA